MKKKKWIDVPVLLLLLGISGVVRIVYAMKFMKEITASDSLLQRTWVTGNQLLSSMEFTLDDMYSACISYAMLFFGNKAIVGVGVNIVLQLVSILFIYLCIRIVSDTLAAAIPTLVISLLPIFVAMISDISSFSLLIPIASFGIWIALLLIRGIVAGICRLIYREDVYLDEEGEEEDSDQEITDTPEEEIASEEVQEEEVFSQETAEEENEEVEEEDLEEPIEYFEQIGNGWKNTADNDTLSERELGALTDSCSTLFQLDQLEEKYRQKDAATTEDEPKEQTQQEISEEEATNDFVTTKETSEAEDTVESQQHKDEASAESEQEVLEQEDKNPKTKLSYEFDFTKYDIENMTGMDFYDIE